jgi:hypothetical protein
VTTELTTDHSDNALFPVQGFIEDLVHNRVICATLLIHETGDAPEVAQARSGGTYPDGSPQQVGAGVTVFLWHGSGVDETLTAQHRSMQIDGQVVDAPTSSSAPGQINLRTTPRGGLSPVNRLSVREDGAVLVLGGGLSEQQGDALAGRGDVAVSGKVIAAGDITARRDANGGASATQVTMGAVGPSSEAGLAFDSTPQARLYLKSSSFLKTDGKLVAGQGLGVGNSAPASAPGNVIRRMQVFDAAGNPLGYIPIYDQIS